MKALPTDNLQNNKSQKSKSPPPFQSHGNRLSLHIEYREENLPTMELDINIQTKSHRNPVHLRDISELLVEAFCKKLEININITNAPPANPIPWDGQDLDQYIYKTCDIPFVQ